MGAEIPTTWGLVLEVEAADGPDGGEPASVLFARGRDALLARCVRLAELLRAEVAEVRVEREKVDPMPVASAGAGARVGVSVVEVRPTSFDMAVRIRPLGEDRGAPAHGRCTIVLARSATGERIPIPRDVRDEFVAIQLSARELC